MKNLKTMESVENNNSHSYSNEPLDALQGKEFLE
jgi:hypothetical protein